MDMRTLRPASPRRFLISGLAVLLSGGLLAGLLAVADRRFLPSVKAGEVAVAPRLVEPARLLPHYDVLVVGASPEGISTAVSAARSGARTLLVDTAPEPGGLITRGWLNQFDLNLLPDGRSAVRGFFAELLSRLGGESFGVGQAKEVFWEFLNAEEKLSVSLGFEQMEPVFHGRLVDGVVLTSHRRTSSGRWEESKTSVTADRVIDATPDAWFATAAGARFTVGRESLGLGRTTMAASLIFRLSGVDWAAVQRYLEDDGDPMSGSTTRSAWGFAEFTRAWLSPDPDLRLRGLNLGRQSDGSVLVNALLIRGVNPLERESLIAARVKAKRALPDLVAYLRQRVPGFAGATLAGVAPELYVRESRHLESLHLLTINDVLEHRDFPDKVTLASYPVDLQPYDQDTGQVIGNPEAYSIPLRALIPNDLDNLLVVGRSAGYDPLAQGSARTLPVGIAEGQAAGVAAALTLNRGLTFPELAAEPRNLAEFRADLERQGAFLPAVASVLPPATIAREQALAHDPVYPAVRLLRRLGLISGGYRNDYHLSEPLTPAEVDNLFREASARYHPAAPAPAWQFPKAPLSRRLAYEEIFARLTATAGN